MKAIVKCNIVILTGLFFVTVTAILFSSCGSEGSEPKPAEPAPVFITINMAEVHQEMIGFGGALTWYSNWMTSSSKKNEIADLIFTDLGIDIVRFKNWYYPDGYPTTTSTTVMNDDNSKLHWDATNELYTMLKMRTPNAKVLLSSWGPPAGLKSNNSGRGGTLKKEGGNFMYNAFGQYCVDILEHLPFHPDYFSIQNEPTYINTGWTTCQWGATETSDFPGYTTAFDNVYNKIKDLPNAPIMIGPESQDVPTFSAFANLLKDKTHCGALAYHPYNINSGTAASQVVSSLQSIGSFTTKPNIMTEFSDNLDWFNTAVFIQHALIHANSSGCIYWKLVWATPTSGTDAGMVSVTNSGQYTVTPFYYLIKHFSKHVDNGYHRVSATSSNANVISSAFVNPANTKLTVILINTSAGESKVQLTPAGKTVTAVRVIQSKQGSYFQSVTAVVSDLIILPSKSITTVVMDI
ncbi:MAG: hypothetical protein JNM57_06990 [Cyclobacteriaceae bacterium]|nr:hypothetical protein [Cyclobacteriaceae bacterium]